jgi:hypothetical protein
MRIEVGQAGAQERLFKYRADPSRVPPVLNWKVRRGDYENSFVIGTVRQNPREEPGALAAHAGICGARSRQSGCRRHRWGDDLCDR